MTDHSGKPGQAEQAEQAERTGQPEQTGPERQLALVAHADVSDESAGSRRLVQGCYDCARCTGRPELARSLGRSTHEVQRLGERCEACGHRLHRHLHGPVRSIGLIPNPDVISVEEPPAESALGRLRARLAVDPPTSGPSAETSGESPAEEDPAQ
jgi:DNA-directed RNA polymerase subunit RPC12/RpoP